MYLPRKVLFTENIRQGKKFEAVILPRTDNFNDLLYMNLFILGQEALKITSEAQGKTFLTQGTTSEAPETNSKNPETISTVLMKTF